MEVSRKARVKKATNHWSKFRYCLDQLIRFRFLVGLFLLALIVLLNLNGSSMGTWSEYVSDRSDGKQTDVIAGQDRGIRSDEWRVQLPFYFSQAKAGYPVNNPNYGMSGQNMIIAYNAPVKDITVIGKPFNWGFFFLGQDRGLSFYWGFKLIGMFLLSFEVGLILTKRKHYLSLLGAFMITFSPAVQWWFMQHLGDLVFFTLGLMVAFYYYFAGHKKRWLRFCMILLAISCGIGYVLVIYPPHQVMFGYVLLFWLIALFSHYRKKISWDRYDLLFIVGGIIFSGLVLLHFYQISKPALLATLNTVYPGHRVAIGGQITIPHLFFFLTNWQLPFSDHLPFINQPESASFFNLYFVSLPVALFVLKDKQARKENFFIFPLFLVSFVALLWMIIGLPAWLAKITLLSYVVTIRAMNSFGFIALLLTIWTMGVVLEKDRFSASQRVLICVPAILIGAYSAILVPMLRNSLTLRGSILSTAIYSLVILLLVFKFKKSVLLLLTAITFIMGCFINPIVQGTGAIFQTKLAQAVVHQDALDAGTWLAEGSLYNFTPALGVKTINSVRFYPDWKLLKLADPQKKDEQVYNRYAHITAFATPDPTTYDLVAPDAITINMNFKLMKKAKVKYVISTRSLDEFNGQTEAVFNRVYGPEKDGWSIFKVAYKKGNM